MKYLKISLLKAKDPKEHEDNVKILNTMALDARRSTALCCYTYNTDHHYMVLCPTEDLDKKPVFEQFGYQCKFTRISRKQRKKYKNAHKLFRI